MTALRALFGRREARVAIAIWAGLPTLFLFFNLTLAVDPAAHIDQVRLGATVLDAGVATPQGQVSVGSELAAALGDRLGAQVVPYPTEDALRAAVLGRDVEGGIVVPAGMTASLQAGQPAELRVVRSDANDGFTNGLTASLANSLGPTINALLPATPGGTPLAPRVTVAADTIAATPDYRFPVLPGFLLLPLWIASIAFAALVSRAGDAVRVTRGALRTGIAELTLATLGAALTAAIVSLDIALFTLRWDIDLLVLFGFLWLACTAIGWLVLGTIRAIGLLPGAALAVLALFLQQPISGVTYPAAFAPEVVRWAAPIAPLRYLVEGIRDVLIGGSTLPGMAVALAWLAVAGLVLAAIGVARHEAVASRAHRQIAAPAAS